MIEARDFVDAARRRGFEWYAGVPCSYLTPFINYVLQDRGLRYVSMANEGDAVALIAGVALAGRGPAADGHSRGISMMQNSGLGNAVSPLTSLTWTFQLPQLLIVTWRGQPGVHDEPQHALMGPITPKMLETMDIPWELFPSEREQIDAVLDRALSYMDDAARPYALVMQKGTVAPYPLARGAGLAGVRAQAPAAATARVFLAAAGDARPTRNEILRAVVAHTSATRTAVLASTGFCGRELHAVSDRANHLYMVGSMGCVVPLALGLALARPDLQVLALDGDGAALMRLGAFATAGAYGPSNFHHLLIDNGVHDSTGGQATVSAAMSFGDIAAACGYASSLETDSVGAIEAWLDGPPANGPRFARILARPGAPADLPRPAHTPIDVKLRLMQHFAAVSGANP